MITQATRSFSTATVPAAPGVSLVEQEARALLVRLGRVKPFALQQTMVPAAALPPASLSAIDRYLIEGRQKVHRMVRKFITWLRSAEGRSASPEIAQRYFSMLRMRFNVTPEWDRLESIWLSYYPPQGLEGEKRKFLELLVKTMPGLATLIAHHRPRSLRGASLQEALQTDKRQPARLSQLFRSWRASRSEMYKASPTIVFAVIGQARAEGSISPAVRAGSLQKC